jgi:hypothetical protein
LNVEWPIWFVHDCPVFSTENPISQEILPSQAFWNGQSPHKLHLGNVTGIS